MYCIAIITVKQINTSFYILEDIWDNKSSYLDLYVLVNSLLAVTKQYQLLINW